MTVVLTPADLLTLKILGGIMFAGGLLFIVGVLAKRITPKQIGISIFLGSAIVIAIAVELSLLFR